MKNALKQIMALALVGLLTHLAQGAVVYEFAGPAVIPDNGIPVETPFTVSGQNGSITDLSLTLNISDNPLSGELGFTGDLYATLTKDGLTAVLLNRVGRTFDNEIGYSDNGFLCTIQMTGADIHNYQSGNFALNANNQLTGNWAADGRLDDPNLVTDTSPRNNTLNVFSGVNPNGDWALTITDISPGGVMQLNSFSVDITAVPEPAPTAAAVSGLLAAFAFLRRPGVRARLSAMVRRSLIAARSE